MSRPLYPDEIRQHTSWHVDNSGYLYTYIRAPSSAFSDGYIQIKMENNMDNNSLKSITASEMCKLQEAAKAAAIENVFTELMRHIKETARRGDERKLTFQDEVHRGFDDYDAQSIYKNPFCDLLEHNPEQIKRLENLGYTVLLREAKVVKITKYPMTKVKRRWWATLWLVVHEFQERTKEESTHTHRTFEISWCCDSE